METPIDNSSVKEILAVSDGAMSAYGGAVPTSVTSAADVIQVEQVSAAIVDVEADDTQIDEKEKQFCGSVGPDVPAT